MNRGLVKYEFPRFPSVFSSKSWDSMWEGFLRDWDEFDKAIFAESGSTPYDVIQTKDDNGNITGTEFHFALAGFDPKDVTIEVDENELKVKVDKSEETEADGKKSYIHKGLARRRMEFSYVLTGQINKDGITASFDDGMLKVNLPAMPKKEVKKIEVKSAKQITEKSESVKVEKKD